MTYTAFVSVLLSALFLVVCSTTFIDPMFDLTNSNQAFNTCTTNLGTEVQISSQCRQLCAEDETCIAFYTYPFSYRWRCFLFPYGERHRYSNSTGQNGISGVKIYLGSKMEADGLYYIVLNKASLNFTNARKDCKISLGYRLALIKTRPSYDVAQTYQSSARDGASWVVVDLQQNIGNKNATFGDGTPFEDSPLAKSGVNLIYDSNLDGAIFIIWGGLNDDSPAQKLSALCQGDPLLMMTY